MSLVQPVWKRGSKLSAKELSYFKFTFVREPTSQLIGGYAQEMSPTYDLRRKLKGHRIDAIKEALESSGKQSWDSFLQGIWTCNDTLLSPQPQYGVPHKKYFAGGRHKKGARNEHYAPLTALLAHALLDKDHNAISLDFVGRMESMERYGVLCCAPWLCHASQYLVSCICGLPQ